MNTLFDQNSAPASDPNKDYLSELVGEGKKFKTVQDLARGKFEADVYIDTLTKRQDEINTDYRRVLEESKAQAKLQDLIDRLEIAKIDNNTPSPVMNDLEKKPAVDMNEIKSLIQTEIVQTKQQDKETENFNQVQRKLKEQFGSNYQTVLKEQMESLELTAEDIDRLAKKSPTAFFNTLGLNQQTTQNQLTPPRTQRNDSFLPRGGEKRDWNYYLSLKKKDPAAWLDPKTAVQMQNDVLELGEKAFYG
jgi:hypothetical protein